MVFVCRLFRSTEQQNSNPRHQRAALRWAEVWNRRRKQAETREWGEDAGDVSPSPFGAVVVEEPALGWRGGVRWQSAELNKFGQGTCYKRCFCLFLSDWLREAAQHSRHPADKALPMWQGLCAEEIVLRAEPATEGKHSNWTKSFGHHLIFSQRMLMLPQSLAALALSRATKVTFPHPLCGTIFVSEAAFANQSPQPRFCPAPAAVVGVDQAVVSAPLCQRSLCMLPAGAQHCYLKLFLQIVFSLDAERFWLGSLQSEHLGPPVEHFAKLFILLVFCLALLPSEIRDKAYLLVAACPGQLRS